MLELLAQVGLPDPADVARRFPHQLSGGMAQRVLIAGAISCNPALLIADEPTTALDVTVQAEILDLLRDLQREYRMGVVLVTHDFGVVAHVCTDVTVMRRGDVLESGTAEQVLNRPQHPYTQGLMRAVPHLRLDEATRAVPRADRRLFEFRAEEKEAVDVA